MRRLYIINTPTGDKLIIGLTLLIISCTAFFLLSIIIEDISFIRVTDFVYYYLGWCIAGIILLASLSMFWLGIYKNRFRRRIRFRRLAYLNRNIKSSSRFPHRQLEYHYYGLSVFLFWRVKRLLRRFPPGSVVLLNPGKDPPFEDIKPIPVPFEPVQLYGDWDRLSELLQVTYPEEYDDNDSNNQSPIFKKTLQSSRAIMAHPYVNILGHVLIFGFLFLPDALWSGVSWQDIPQLIVAGTMLALPFTVYFFMEDQWWLVPNGLPYRKYRLWRRNPPVGLYTSELSTLLFNVRKKRLLITQGKAQEHMSIEPYHTVAILSAWKSSLPPPTKEQIDVFLVDDMSSTKSRKG